MGFREHLERVVASVDGAVMCSLVGFDGIAIDTHQPEARAAMATKLDLSTAMLEYGNVLSQLKDAAQTLKTGVLSEVSVNSEHLLTIMRLVTQEYFVVLALLPEGNYGKGRYALRLAAPNLAKEL